ncbi:hypothetical protein A4G19_10595 [Pasteurellaceae bacterium Macca]|nr:hypothetical protein [Pasteurellaceae bacterium Macca]MCK3656172.1 hypothetical protein [Pasteurellaceae bacterium Macca]
MKFTDKSQSQRSFTRDGYLVVPATLSRLGVFDYLGKELGLSDNSVKKVARTEQSLFSDSTVKSFEGVPITLGHPEDDVNAHNWKALAVGNVRNVKRDGDMLAGEAWIYDAEAISLIQDKGIEELSCGYRCDIQPSTLTDADFEMLPMVGNHVAIVPKGRCGSNVKLGDEGKPKMTTTRKFLDALLGVFGTKLTDEQAKEVEEKEKTASEKTPPQEKTPPNKAVEKEAEKPAEKPKEQPKEKEKEKVKDEALTARIAELEAENQQLRDEKAKVLRQEKEQAVVSGGFFAQDEAAKLSDAELNGAYVTAQMVAKKMNDQHLGAVLLGDSKETPTAFDFNSYNQGAN